MKLLVILALLVSSISLSWAEDGDCGPKSNVTRSGGKSAVSEGPTPDATPSTAVEQGGKKEEVPDKKD